MPEIQPAAPDSGAIPRLFERQKARAVSQKAVAIGERKSLLKAFERFLLQNRQRIADEIHKDFQKPLGEILLSELYPVLTEIRYAVSNLGEWARPKKVDAPMTYLGTRSEIRFEPKGVCLIISPWNYPFNLCFGPLISCLAAGNTAILKPSELTPNASRLAATLVREFFDKDLVACVEGGVDVSTELLSLPFDHVFFTGSPEVGKIVMKAAAKNLTSVTLELGGKSPTIVDKTADLPNAARRIAFGKFLNNGQTCIAPDYVIVERSVREELIAELRKSIVALFGENGRLDESSPAYARIVNEKNFQRLTGLVEDAVSNGATVELNGPVNPLTRFIHPVILSPRQNARIMNEEVFGPILPMISFSSVDEVVSIVNSKSKPLALYLFSNDKRFREQILLGTSAGGVCINDCLLQFSHPELPFGGVNHSGIGKAHGHYGFLAFSNEKPVVKQRRGMTSSFLIQPPYTKMVKKIVDFMLKWA